MIDIIERTLELLKNNIEWEERYAKYIEFLSEKRSKGFRKPEGLSVYSSVSNYKGSTYDLRFDGQSVGLVVSKSGEITLYPKEKANTEYFAFSTNLKNIDWHKEEATRFRKFYKDLAKSSTVVKIKSPEHRVENRLLMEFAKRTRAEDKQLTSIQPIKLNGCFFQLPTPLKASDHNPKYAEHKGGGIDILSRIKIHGESRLCVMEVKDENKKSEPQSKAMEQALSYATFIASLLRSKSGQKWWDFLMGRNGKSSQIPATVNIDVVTIMPKGNTEEFEKGEIDLTLLGAKFYCYSLYYDNDSFDEGKGKFIFSGSFLEHLGQIHNIK
jgi:hypothetical protein